MFTKSSGLKKIGIGLAIWGFVKTIWDTIGHIGNVQTLWDMISAAVQYWPSFLRGTLWVATSWWFPLIASTICLLLWWFLSRAEKKRGFAAVTFEDAIIAPIEGHDGIQVLRHLGAAAKNEDDVIAKLLPEPKQGAPVLVEIINKSQHHARLYSAKLLGVDANGREESLLTPRHIIANDLQQWKGLPFVMDPKSRIKIAFAGMCLAMLPRQYTGYLVEIELEDESKIRSDKRLSFSNILGDEQPKPSRPVEEWQRFSYDEEQRIIEIFENSPNVPVAISAVSTPTNEFRTGLEFAGWLTEALKKAQVAAEIYPRGNPETLPDGVSIYWKKNDANDDMVGRIKKAVAIKSVICREVPRPVVLDSEINLMVKLHAKPPS